MIHVRTIRTGSFMGHREIKLELPDSGVVVITGPNGAGKSTLVEAVAVALWGKTLRGTPWWTDGTLATVRVETDRVVALRERDGAKTNAVRWGLSTSDLRDFETATKAQEELDPIVGSFDAWRRASVFSSQDLLTFSLATDGERKRLLEGMLGLDVFDRGLVACRAEASGVKLRAAELERKVGRLEAKLEVERKRLVDAGEALGPEPPTVDLNRVARQARNAAEDRKELAATVRKTETFLETLERTKREAEGELSRLAELVTCPTCGQNLPDAARASFGEKARGKIDWAETRLPATRESLEASSAELEELEEELAVLTERLASLRESAATRRAWEERAARAAEKTDEVRRVVEELEADLAALGHDLAVAQGELAELAVVEKVLGLKGVRTHVVARAVAGLASVANAWLDRLLPGATVKLRAGSDSRGGNMTNRHDTIELEVHGLGHAGAYKACSGGERRRVDVALLLALAEVRAASAGSIPGTLWFDEVFDTLDGDGIAAVSEALRDVARDRCVVLVTHSDELADEVDAVARYAVRDGVLES